MKKKQVIKPEKAASVMDLRKEKKEIEKQIRDLVKQVKLIDKKIAIQKRIRDKATKAKKK